MGKDSKGSYNHSGQYVKISRNGKYFSAYSNDPAKPHERMTINIDNEENTFRVDYHNEDKTIKTSNNGKCYLTTACLRHTKEQFDDKSYELQILRWFRDNFVSKEDIDYYYKVAPIIVDAINEQKDWDTIYESIYQNVIRVCIKAIESNDYLLAYNRYKESILQLEKIYVNKEEKKLVKTL